MTAFAAPIPPSTPYALLEIRGHATLERSADQIGILRFQLQFSEEEAPLIDFLRKHDVVDTTVTFRTDSKPAVHILSLSPADRQTFLDLFAEWTRDPDTPEGFQVFVPPSASFRYHIASADGKTAFSKDPDALRAALAFAPSIPDRLPADGDIAWQGGGEEVMRTSFFPPALAAEIQDNVETLTVGLGTDADSLVLHAILVPRPVAKLASHLRLCGPIPPSTACVNLPGAIAFVAEGPAQNPFGASLPPGSSSALARRIGNQPVSAALYPPATPGAIPRALVFQDVNDLPTARPALLSLLSRHSDAFSLASADPYRGIPVDTLAIASADAFQALLSRSISNSTSLAFIGALAKLNPTLSFAWLPDGLLLAFNDTDSSLLHGAIDAVLDATSTPLDPISAFQTATPASEAPVHYLIHLDLPAIAPYLPRPYNSLCRQVPAPCPVDLVAGGAPGTSLVIRLRAPLSLPQAFTAPRRTRQQGGTPTPQSFIPAK